VSIATEPENLDELIADCAHIPQSLHAESRLEPPSAAQPWSVDDACHAQVAELDLYI
jgi:hypothetical protein